MGKHSMPKTHKRAFNKTMAIALAAGVSFGGVQVVSAQTGHDVAGQAVAAEAGTLDAKVLTGHSVISSKSKQKVQDIKSFNTLEGEKAFVDAHSDQFTFTADLTIPDDAKAGQTMAFKIDGAFSVVGQDGTGRDVNAVADGFKMGKWVKQGDTVTFTLDKDATEYKNRKAHFEVPLKLSPLTIGTSDESKKGKSAPQEGTVTLVSTGKVLERFAYGAPYTYAPASNGNVNVWDVDYPLDSGSDMFNETDPNLNTGRVHVALGQLSVGSANYTLSNVEDGNPIKWAEGPDVRRDVSIKYTIDNPNYKLVPYDGKYGETEKGEGTTPGLYFHKGRETYDSAYNPVLDKTTYSIYDGARYKGTEQIKKETGIDYSVDIADDGQSAIIHFNNVRARDGFWAYRMLAVDGEYQPGDEVNVHAEFVNGVGDPHKNYDFSYTGDRDGKLRFPDITENASGDKINITKSAEMKALVNGNDANNEKSAEKISNGKAKFSIELKNTGTIGTTGATVKFPKGVTDADGKSERYIDFGKAGFAPGSTKKIDLGELNVANGVQENKFTVEMKDFKTMSDPAWTNSAKTADSVDPTWGNAEVPDGGTKKIPAGGGAKDAPKGTKYELTGNHPDWITIDGKTGEITAKPPKGTKPGKNQVTVTTTFPDGSKDTDKPVITVIHDDVYIDGKPDVKPDGTVTLHRNDGKDIIFKVPTGSKVEVNKDGDLVITQPDGKKETVPLKHTTVTESGKPGTPDHKIIITDENGKTHEFGTYDKFLESVKDDGKGNYTFIMNDGTKLGPIQLGDDIVGIADDGKGNLIVTHKDGSKDTVPLKHTTVKEEGKPGEDGYKITLTTPDGKKVTLDGYDNYVESITKQDNGDYLVKRNDGTEWTIKLSDIRDDIKKLKGKDAEQDKRLDDLEGRVDGIDKEIENLGDRITKNEGAIEDHRKSINDLNQEVGSINNELGDIKDELARLDGQDIKEVRDNGDGTYTLIRNNGDEVTGVIDTSGDIKSITDNGDGTITLTHNDGSTEVVDLTHTKVETKGKPGDKDYTVTITTPDGNKVTLNGSNTYPSKVKDNGDGTYTIILNDGTEVPGKIGDGQDIKELVPNEDGTMTIIHKDGSESVVDLKQVEITEQNKGTPEHTVTITSPNGDTVTFNVFDKYVTNVVKNEDGNYDIFRSDVDGGNTVWKTIVLSDLREKIADLEDRADGLEEKDKDLQKQIDDLKGRLDNAEKEIESLKDRTSDLEKAVAKINARLSVIDMKLTSLGVRMDALEGRVDTIEETEHAWGQCFGGILATAIPLLAAAPLVAGSNIQIPGAAEWNNQIQRTLGIYNEQLSRMAGQYSGVAKAAATILGVAGGIGLMVHTAKACGPYSKTDAMKDTKAGKLSSKLDKREGSSREK